MIGFVITTVAAALIEALLPSGSMKKSAEKLISLAAAAEMLALIFEPLIKYFGSG